MPPRLEASSSLSRSDAASALTVSLTPKNRNKVNLNNMNYTKGERDIFCLPFKIQQEEFLSIQYYSSRLEKVTGVILTEPADKFWTNGCQILVRSNFRRHCFQGFKKAGSGTWVNLEIF